MTAKLRQNNNWTFSALGRTLPTRQNRETSAKGSQNSSKNINLNKKGRTPRDQLRISFQLTTIPATLTTMILSLKLFSTYSLGTQLSRREIPTKASMLKSSSKLLRSTIKWGFFISTKLRNAVTKVLPSRSTITSAQLIGDLQLILTPNSRLLWRIWLKQFRRQVFRGKKKCGSHGKRSLNGVCSSYISFVEKN